MTTKEIVLKKKKLTREEIRSEISGNYCRCTGYQSIVDAIEESITEVI
jgi:carbon-monoxide dehydrogenase small subunit